MLSVIPRPVCWHLCTACLVFVSGGWYKKSNHLVSSDCHPWQYLLCRAEFITWHLKCFKRGMPMGSSIFLHLLHMSLNSCVATHKKWPYVRSCLVESILYWCGIDFLKIKLKKAVWLMILCMLYCTSEVTAMYWLVSWLVCWLVLQHVNSCWVILYPSQFNNYGLQLYMVKKMYFHNHFR